MFWDLDLLMHYVLGSSSCCRDMDRLAARSRSRDRDTARVMRPPRDGPPIIGGPLLRISMTPERDRRRPMHHQPIQWPAHLLREHASYMENLRHEYRLGGQGGAPQTIMQMRVWSAECALDQESYVFRNKGGGKTGGKATGGAGEEPPPNPAPSAAARQMQKGKGKGGWANAWRARAVVMGLGEPRRQIQRPPNRVTGPVEETDRRARSAALLAVPKAAFFDRRTLWPTPRSAYSAALIGDRPSQLDGRRRPTAGEGDEGDGGGFAERARMDPLAEAHAAFLVLPQWLANLQNELNFQPRQAPDVDAEDQRVLPPCAPRLLTAGGYNRHHYEVEVRMHMRASVYT